MNLENVIKAAIKMEEEGYSFYKKAEGCTKDAFGKKMYASLAEYEVHHKKLLEGLLKNIAPESKDLDIPLPKEKLRSVFAEIKKDVCVAVPSTAGDIDALSLAMTKETESYKMYSNASRQSPDPKVKAMFERMAQEENEHYEILEQTKYFLEQYANWSIWQEGGPIEGG